MADSGVNIKIAAHVEIGEMRKVEDALQREIVQLKLAGVASKDLEEKFSRLSDIRKKISDQPNSTKWRAAVEEAAGSIPGVGPLFTAINGSAASIAAGIGIVTAGFRLAADSVRAFAASEVEMAKLDAALANSGKLTDEYRKKLSDLATARSQATAIDDEKFISAITTLTKFGADDTNIESYLRAVENLAGFLGGDMDQAAFLFGKAMAGSTEMLGRYGIEVDKSKSQTEQLADIMRQLEQRGGGQLEAMASTLTGSMTKIENAWENLLESMGSMAEKSGLANYLDRFASGLQHIAGSFGVDSAPKSKNREVLVGTSAESQAEADGITSQLAALQKSRAELLQNSAERFALLQDPYEQMRVAQDRSAADKSAGNPVRSLRDYMAELRDSEQLLIDANDNTVENIDAAIAALNTRKTELGLRVGTPDEAAAARASGQQYGPEYGPEAQAAAEKARIAKEAVAAKRSELDLELRISEARASGNDEDLKRLQWIKDYTAALISAKDAGMGDAAEEFARRSANAISAKSILAEKEKNAERAKALELETRINEARAGGNEKEVARLEWLKQYNDLMAQGASEDAARRAANASMAAGSAAQAKPDPFASTSAGDLFSGTRRRRGAFTSDAFETSIDAGRSLLDDYKANQQKPVGAKNGKSILGDDPSSQVADAAAPAKEAASKMAEISKNLESANTELSGAAEAANRAAGEAKSAGSALKGALSSMRAEIAALKRASSAA